MKNTLRIIWFLIVFVVVFTTPLIINGSRAASVQPATQPPYQVMFQNRLVRTNFGEHISWIESIERYLSSIFVNLNNGVEGDKLILGGDYILRAGEIITGDLLIIGGNVILETGSLVNGDVVTFGGSIQIDGKISGDVFTLGGETKINSSAIVEGEMASIGGNLEVDEGATIKGNVLEGITGPIPIPVPVHIPSLGDLPGRFNIWTEIGANRFVEFGWLFLRSIVWAVGALFLALFFSQPMETVGRTAISQPVLSGGLGLMTIFVAPFALVLFAITIIGIPISLFLFILLAIIWLFGMISIGMETGIKFAKILNLNWAFAFSAGVGTFLLTLLLNVVRTLIPCIGWIIPVLVGIIGIGSVLLTRLGTREYLLLQNTSMVNKEEMPLSGTGD